MPQQAREGNDIPGLIGFQEIGCHVVFDVKMNFMRKDHFAVAGGHSTTTSHGTELDDILKCTSIMWKLCPTCFPHCSLEWHWICPVISRMHISMPHAEKRFGSREESNAAKTMARYVSWFIHFMWTQILQEDLGYKSSKADPDVWLHKAAANGWRSRILWNVIRLCRRHPGLSHCKRDAIHEITEFYKVSNRRIFT